MSSDLSLALKRSAASERSMPSTIDIDTAIGSTMTGIGCESIDGDGDDDMDEDIEVEDVDESDDEDKELEDDTSEQDKISSDKHLEGSKENKADDDIQVI